MNIYRPACGSREPGPGGANITPNSGPLSSIPLVLPCRACSGSIGYLRSAQNLYCILGCEEITDEETSRIPGNCDTYMYGWSINYYINVFRYRRHTSYELFGTRPGPSKVSGTINLDLYHEPVKIATRNRNSSTS
jgi:hypothetical protein